jgi:hypothetical protein
MNTLPTPPTDPTQPQPPYDADLIARWEQHKNDPPQIIPSPKTLQRRRTARLILGAGVAAIIGSYLPWASISAPIIGTMTVSGIDGGDGWITAGLGILLILYGTLALRRQPHVALGAAAALAGIGAAGVGVWDVINLRMRIADAKAEMAAAPDDDFGIGAAMAEAVQAHVGVGLWLVIAAGAVAAGAAMVGLWRQL